MEGELRRNRRHTCLLFTRRGQSLRGDVILRHANVVEALGGEGAHVGASDAVAELDKKTRGGISTNFLLNMNVY
jgi:hypothetical protein